MGSCQLPRREPHRKSLGRFLISSRLSSLERSPQTANQASQSQTQTPRHHSCQNAGPRFVLPVCSSPTPGAFWQVPGVCCLPFSEANKQPKAGALGFECLARQVEYLQLIPSLPRLLGQKAACSVSL